MRIRIERGVLNGAVTGWTVIVGDAHTGVFTEWNDAVAYCFILVTTAAKKRDLTIETEPTSQGELG